jgi:hypothetical protein
MQAVALQPDHEEARMYLALGLLAKFEEGEGTSLPSDSDDCEDALAAKCNASMDEARRPHDEVATRNEMAEAVLQKKADPESLQSERGSAASLDRLHIEGWAKSVRGLLRLPDDAKEKLLEQIENWSVSELERWRRNGVQTSMHPLPAAAVTDCSMWPPLSCSLGLGCSSVPQIAAALLMLARIHVRRRRWSALRLPHSHNSSLGWLQFVQDRSRRGAA